MVSTSHRSWSPTGTEIPDDAPPSERRQVTVLFADLTGFTALSTRTDPEQMVELLGAYFEVVDGAVLRHGGRLDKHIGDAVMAVFGAPKAYGDESRRALRAASEMHEGLAQVSAKLGVGLSAHVGIATGEVLAGLVGSRHLKRYTVLGDTPNLASRLDSMAEGGQTLVSDEVRRAVGKGARFESQGRHKIKGFAGELEVWRLVEMVDGEVDEVPLVGREGLLDQLVARIESGPGRTVLEAEPGLGRSRVLRALGRRLRSKGRRYLRVELPPAAIAERDRLESIVARALAADMSGASAELFEALLGELDLGNQAALYDLLVETAPEDLRALTKAMSPSRKAAGRDEALIHLLRRWVGEGGVIALDDAHHLDEEGRAHLQRVSEGSEDLPLHWVISTRSERHVCEGVEAIRLSPLSEACSRSLTRALREAAGHQSDPDRDRMLIENARGNPFLLTQLVHSSDGSGWAAAANGPDASETKGGLPAAVANVVLARLDAMTSESRRAIQVLAVLGPRLPSALAQSLKIDAAALCEQGIAREEVGEFRLVQDLVREAAAASTLNAERRRLHVHAADWYAQERPELPEQCAEHLDRAGHEDAPSAWLRAAKLRQEEERLDQALRLVERGCRGIQVEPGSGPRDLLGVDLWLTRAEILNRLYRAEEALELLEQVKEQEKNPRLWLELGEAHRFLLNGEAFAASIQRAVPLSEKSQDPRLRARVLLLSSSAAFIRGGDPHQALAIATEARRYAVDAGDRALELGAVSNAADVQMMLGRLSEAMEAFERCVSEGREHGLRRIEIANTVPLAMLHMLMGRAQQGEEMLVSSTSLADVLREGRTRLLSTVCRGYLLGLLGRYEEAQACWEMANTLVGGQRDLHRQYEGVVQFLRGEEEEPYQWAIRNRADLFSGLRATASTALGLIVAGSKDPEERAAALADARGLWKEGATAVSRHSFFTTVIEAHLRRGEHAEAQAFKEEMLENFAAETPLMVKLQAERVDVLTAERWDEQAAIDLADRLETMGYLPLVTLLRQRIAGAA